MTPDSRLWYRSRALRGIMPTVPLMKNLLIALIKKAPFLERRLRSFMRSASPKTTILLDYPVDARPRYIEPHPRLSRIIGGNRDLYADHLKEFLKYQEAFLRIPRHAVADDPAGPFWLNGLIPGLDAIALYGFLCGSRPKRYFEIGSGHSTRFARRAVTDQGLGTKITSIDPHPRAEIEAICDLSIRSPLETVDMEMFDELESGDILFVDNSHRVFMNSDVTVTFLDILPRLNAGVLVEFHDIFLPFDYPAEWIERYYSEQYMLAAYLLAGGERFEILLPNAYLGEDPDLRGLLAPLWERPEMQGVQKTGGSFWIRMK